MDNYHFAAFICGFITAWIVSGIEVVNMTPRRRRGSNPCGGGEITRAEWDAMRTPRRGSNPPSPGTKPQPPSGPPQPLAAQLIRYWTWEADQTRQAFTEGPTTPKPQFPAGRVLGPDGETIGHRSIPSPRKP